MKYLIILLTVFSLTAKAEDVPPSYLKDAVITVTLKNGKTYTYSANEYKVVKRGTSKPTPVMVAQPESHPAPTPHSESNHKNRVSLVVGYGLNGKLNESMTPSTVDVEQQKGAVGGIVLQRDLNKEYHLMGGAMTNQTFFLGFGKGF